MLALAVALMATTACHRTQLVGTSDENGSVTVKVINTNRLDVVLYLVHDSYRERLGEVTSTTTREFAVKFKMLGAGHEFVLLADPVGSLEPIRTDTVHPLDGQIVTWTLESDFSRSHLQVF
jgi:hypothetical protein